MRFDITGPIPLEMTSCQTWCYVFPPLAWLGLSKTICNCCCNHFRTLRTVIPRHLLVILHLVFKALKILLSSWFCTLNIWCAAWNFAFATILGIFIASADIALNLICCSIFIGYYLCVNQITDTVSIFSQLISCVSSSTIKIPSWTYLFFFACNFELNILGIGNPCKTLFYYRKVCFSSSDIILHNFKSFFSLNPNCKIFLQFHA